MGEETRPCPHCQAPIRLAARFCGTCGKRVEGAVRAPGAMGKTMVGVSAQDLPAVPAYLAPRGSAAGPAAPAAHAPQALPAAPRPTPAQPVAPAAVPAVPARPSHPRGPMAGTMIGLSGQLPAAPQALAGTAAYPATPAAAPVPPAPPPGPPPAPQGTPKATMLGLSGAQPGVPPAPPGAPKSTMLGMSGPLPGMPQVQPLAATAPYPAAPAAPMPAPVPPATPKAGVTMLGLPPGAAPVLPMPARPTAPSQAGATMLGLSPSAPVQVPAVGLPGAPAVSSGRWRIPAIAWISFAIGAVALLAAAVAFFLRGREAPQVQARVLRESEAEWLEFTVAGVPEGAKVRLGGQEQPLQAGRTRFALAADSLRVGDNAVLADVVYADGDVHPVRLMLGVDYRIRIDTSPLEAGKTSVDVIVTARPGSEVVLDGEKLELDAEGRGVRSSEIDVDAASSAGTYEHVVRYRVQPPAAEPSVGEQKTQIAIASLHIDRPGLKLTTDRDVVEIAGAVAKGGKVTIDGQTIPVHDGRFLHRFALPTPGDYKPRIMAFEKGKAPMTRTLELARVADLAEAARDFKPEPELDYAKIAQNPAIYKGARIEIEGRVYHVNVKDGRSVLQTFARDCPGGQRCPLWVTHPAATHFTVGDWVRVLGTVEGEQQFRAESDEIVRVPKVEAAFLLPVSAPEPE